MICAMVCYGGGVDSQRDDEQNQEGKIKSQDSICFLILNDTYLLKDLAPNMIIDQSIFKIKDLLTCVRYEQSINC